MCGVFGIRSVERDVSRLAYFGLFALQHRGQESAGIAVSEEGRLTVVREMGLVAHVFGEDQLSALPGEVATRRRPATGSTTSPSSRPGSAMFSRRTVGWRRRLRCRWAWARTFSTTWTGGWPRWNR